MPYCAVRATGEGSSTVSGRQYGASPSLSRRPGRRFAVPYPRLCDTAWLAVASAGNPAPAGTRTYAVSGPLAVSSSR